MQFDELTIEVLPDGTIKSTADEISAPNHDNAEQFLKHMARLAGGPTTRRRRTDVPAHRHAAHVHSHDHTKKAGR